MDVLDSFIRLKSYCEKEGYKGWDPYDGLNSKIFKSLKFLNRSALCRLIIIQGFKRCPVNLRKWAMVPKEYNAKGIALFLTGYCNIYKVLKKTSLDLEGLGTLGDVLNRINFLSNLLIDLRSKGNYHGSCWGYNFDWQARRLFLFPKYTPTIVATSFCATSLMEAYEITKKKEYLEIALSSADFIINDLHRTKYKKGFLFSYSPLKGNDTVINASLLGARLLSYCYKYTSNDKYIDLARNTIQSCCLAQKNNGAWVYGILPIQSWVDSFHTGYNLDGLIAYRDISGDNSFDDSIDRGFQYYIDTFFKSNGMPKYYNNATYPIDIHCPGQLMITLSRMKRYSQYQELVDKVARWTILNMQDPKGYFYYQLKKGFSSKISYMRWSNAFMFNALSYYILNTYNR